MNKRLFDDELLPLPSFVAPLQLRDLRVHYALGYLLLRPPLEPHFRWLFEQ